MSCGGRTCSVDDYGIRMALLDQGEHGSLNTCGRRRAGVPPAPRVTRDVTVWGKAVPAEE
ncbi:hypothetical protein [Streptomyces sp. NPDC001851]|uniref:hypothetical protein n=1 Tax=Streptomyces sp. NPDC001851 TaxID=3154529 RepID=UPI003326DE7D